MMLGAPKASVAFCWWGSNKWGRRVIRSDIDHFIANVLFVLLYVPDGEVGEVLNFATLPYSIVRSLWLWPQRHYIAMHDWACYSKLVAAVYTKFNAFVRECHQAYLVRLVGTYQLPWAFSVFVGGQASKPWRSPDVILSYPLWTDSEEFPQIRFIWPLPLSAANPVSRSFESLDTIFSRRKSTILVLHVAWIAYSR